MNGQTHSTPRVTHPSHYFEPDIVAPYEYSLATKRYDHFYPEEKLMFAVLTDAVECFQRYAGAQRGRSRTLFEQAEAWIFGCENDSLYSFEAICEALRISPGYLRDGLKRWRAERDPTIDTKRRLRAPLRYPYRIRSQRISS